MKAIACFLVSIILLSLMSNVFAAQHFKYQALVLYGHLAPSKIITPQWQQTIVAEVTAAKVNQPLIDAICPINSPCAQGAYSFTNEITGLVNLLALDQTVIAACYGKTFSCIAAHDQTMMFAATSAQVRYELQMYLVR